MNNFENMRDTIYAMSKARISVKDLTKEQLDRMLPEEQNQYTSIRKFYAWFGFISILFCIGILVYSLIWSINYINHDIETYEPHSSLLGEIEELKAVVDMQKKVIEKAEEVINEQKVLLILKDMD